MIDVINVTKDYKIYKRKSGIINNIKSVFNREYEIKKAVGNVSFHIDEGEIVGYVGPNGAGKSTTVKMLCGILVPTKGEVTINGRIPHKQRIENAKDIGAVFGQRTQLYWNLPLYDSFELHKKLYEIDDKEYKRNKEQFIEVLEMKDFIAQPVRQLSLGQKMRANIAISLLHNPKIVYLDEPTIGLDIVAKRRIREFIKVINDERKTTFVFTTHDMDDIEETCNRLIIIDEGKIRYDGDITTFKAEYGDNYSIEVEMDNGYEQILNPMLKTIKLSTDKDNKQIIIGNKKDISIADAVTYIAQNHQISDINIKESDIESILLDMYTKRK